MLKLALISLLVTQGLCYASNALPRARASTPGVGHFPWDAFKENTGVDETKYLKPPAKGVAVTYACTKKPGPKPNDCSSAFSDWAKQADSKDLLHVDAGKCTSITDGTCEVVVCAPLGKLSIKTDEITGRMWNPLMIKCIMGGTSGIYQSEDSQFVIGIATPVK